MRVLVAALALGALVAPSMASAQSAPTRYSLAGGCYALDGVPGGEKVRMQASGLGSYLLYRADGTFISAGANGAYAVAAQPSPAADWTVTEAGAGAFRIAPASAPNDLRTMRPTTTTGCADYPEAPLNARGEPARGETSYGAVRGLIEGHMHWMTYQYFGGNFHCGKPWDAYGITHALPDCSSIEGPQGTAATFQNILNFGNPAQPHDTRGYPYLTSWGPDNLTYEGTYYRWIERAWASGLRLMIMGVNENRILCQLQSNRRTSCNEMDTVRTGFAALRRLQDYVDAQAGGPGRGFFQIVTDPLEARRVINAGRMAVVMEIEISEPFNCSGWDAPTCTKEQVDQQLDEMHRLGVRSMLLLNKFDNPLTGVRFDSGATGLLINAGNRASAGSFWDAKTCTGPLRDNEILQPSPQVAAGASSLLTSVGLPGNTAPAYPAAPHCNTRGLTALGKHVVERMMDLKMIVNPDHMSQAGVDATLSTLEARRYSGVISPHGWMDPGNWPRLWKLGGLAFPGHSSASEYVADWEKYRPKSTPYRFGWGYGADLGGLSHQPKSGEKDKVEYPFRGIDGAMTFDRQKTGERSFDYNAEGVSTYGQYADWFADLARQGGTTLRDDMLEGAEAYLEMWERAEGIASPACAPARGKLSTRGLRGMRLRSGWESLLKAAGQPQQRTRVWSWCVSGAGNERKADAAVLSAPGLVQLVGSTAKGRSAGGVKVGARASSLGRRVRDAGGGVRYRPTANGAFVYDVRKGRVRAVASVTRGVAGRKAAMRAAIRQLRTARATSATRAFVPSAATARAAAAPTGVPLAGTSDARLNAQLTYLCMLQVS